MKKKNRTIIIIFILLVLLFPFKITLKDGGTTYYNAFLYKIIKWHKLDNNYDKGYKEGVEFHIFPTNLHEIDYYDEPRPPRLEFIYNDSDIYGTIYAKTGSYHWCNNYQCLIADTVLEENFLRYTSILVDKNDSIKIVNSPLKLQNITIYKDNFDNIVDEEIEFDELHMYSLKESGEYLYKLYYKDNRKNVEYYIRIIVK